MQAEKKHINLTVKAASSPDAPYGSFEAILSAPTVDRDGEVIASGAFDPLPQSIPIFADHVASVTTMVARAVPSYEGGLLLVRGKFASDEMSQMVRQKILDGIVTEMSVGFMVPEETPNAWQSMNGQRTLVKGELLEGSFVGIPSNRQALVLSGKALAADILEHVKAGRRNSAADQERLQKAHDLLAEAGATCKDARDGDSDMPDGENPEADGDDDEMAGDSAEADGKSNRDLLAKMLSTAVDALLADPSAGEAICEAAISELARLTD